MKYKIQDREAGNKIDDFDTYKIAEKKLAEFEESDREEGIYEENFYQIVPVTDDLMQEINDNTPDEIFFG